MMSMVEVFNDRFGPRFSPVMSEDDDVKGERGTSSGTRRRRRRWRWSYLISLVTFSNYGTGGIGEPLEIRVLSGRSFSRSFSLFAFAVQ
ncbi:hypothetical protein HanXRQr2_Chr17g0794841 [Helianthus annuus]|uniref:Uncharacterized protein n=1 Tax=Helianthus annuus TaxID=4232 RepID=A0A9K3DG36_HELAN|nr:hypothetical protein HanXRQr2_Chr17g0794841 [Helianthus annuus]